MLDEIEAVFENGVFRPLQPVQLPEHQRVTLLVPGLGEAAKNGAPTQADEFEEVDYRPLPLQQCKTIRVKVRQIGQLPPVPYPVEADEMEQE